MLIYKITNTVNNKKYIGLTTRRLCQRWAEHCSGARNNSSKVLCQAIRKHGVDNFLVEMIDDSARSLEDLYQKEKYYIEHYNTFNSNIGYNCTDGGKRFAMSNKERLKRSQSMLGRKLSEETKRKISITKLKHPTIITDEYRSKISKSSTGRVFSKESIEKRADKLRGQKRTIQQKQRMREAAIGRTNTNQQKERVSKSLKESYLHTLSPFELYKNGKLLGTFLKQVDFYKPNNIINYNSLNKLINGKITTCKGISVKILNININEFLKDNTPTNIAYKGK